MSRRTMSRTLAAVWALLWLPAGPASARSVWPTDIRCPTPPDQNQCAVRPYDAGVRILVDNPSGLSAVGFDLEYDSSKITYVPLSGRKAGATASWPFFDCNDLAMGGTTHVVRCGGFSTSSVSSTAPDSLASLVFHVDLADDQSTLITLKNFTDDLQGLPNSGAVPVRRSSWGAIKIIYR